MVTALIRFHLVLYFCYFIATGEIEELQLQRTIMLHLELFSEEVLMVNTHSISLWIHIISVKLGFISEKTLPIQEDMHTLLIS